MSKINDGGPAFPGEYTDLALYREMRPEIGTIPAMKAAKVNSPGMALRDYFAIHCDQPGAAEIVSAAGLVYSEGKVWSDGAISLGSFDTWWRDLGQAERLRLYADVRYAMADALLAARVKGGDADGV